MLLLAWFLLVCSLTANFLSFLFVRYHPACVGMNIEEAKRLDHFVCSECSDDDARRLDNGFSASPADDVKVTIPGCISHVVWLSMPAVFMLLFLFCCFVSPQLAVLETSFDISMKKIFKNEIIMIYLGWLCFYSSN